jgi:hypothetical protein
MTGNRVNSKIEILTYGGTTNFVKMNSGFQGELAVWIFCGKV